MVVVVEDTLVQHRMKKDNQEQLTQEVVEVVEEEILQEDVVVQEVQVLLLLNTQVQLEQLVAALTLHAELLDTYLQVQVIWLFRDIYKIDTLLRLKYKI
jgi:thiamine monophosphate synthase